MKLLPLIAIIAGIAVFLMIYYGLKVLFNNRLLILQRIKEITEKKKKITEEDPYSLPFKERVIQPVLQKLEKSILKWMPYSLKIREQQLLKQAGYPNNLTLQQWMSWRMVIWFLVGGFLTFYGINQNSLLLKLLVIVTGWILGYYLPVFYLKKKKSSRQSEIEQGLPYVLDILTVSVEAGLGFDSALMKVIEKTKGNISLEFQKTLQEIKMGKSRKESLKDLGERTDVENMIQFVNSIVQAEQLGVRMGKVLRVQAEDMRQKRKQKAEEKAMKAPIKILFPLILFIFPTIFIIILGPAVINMVNTFFK